MVWYHTHNRSCSEFIYFNTRPRAFPSFVLYILYSFEKGTQVHIHDVFMENEVLPVKKKKSAHAPTNSRETAYLSYLLVQSTSGP